MRLLEKKLWAVILKTRPDFKTTAHSYLWS